ncbi:DNA topoisomerase I [Candidatus Giovannonibacteria bacterium RIFCSPHIGHO2_01_FULL_45_33]|uniref:DNA topoisomerase 1 n=1 Tax=Candidatus Giovannonibacteria bacterium RIFCSPLOWO2_01_FULL_45_34 TaxID=1798351 RepID=A0A1F5WYA4_9BACT|nr:MAG: DNA topoisomerase I [Candidatus Giovannonibacteria bacterium RIFCSPHIGHO2_01_FULL_45_33]OGF69170.1 MAG: DNA topoisomerase I [Candidatus Giovannonibacteria bacterium RIFCSPHIGHO2_02_FULL_44_11]OGF80624.1 MAG: DNA topoisomerase I [Candidatus Giovannonibacteria bacterium RIFCSPLOWO2_01_FULL_45_34]
MKLIIVESPTKARTISKFLGKGFHIESSFGHVRDLPKSQLGVDPENNFQPKYIVPLKAKKNLNVLKKQAAKADEIILATDEDREGEAIAWHLLSALGIEDKPGDKIHRIVFHEITERAIKEALKNPRDIDMNLVNAQQARRILDRLVGYKLSPFLWKKVARGLSAGRVQSVAVRLITEREAEIDAFKKDEYWTVEGMFAKEIHPPAGGFKGELYKIAGKTLEKFGIKNENEAKKIPANLAGASAKVVSAEKSSQLKHSAAPFTTSTLQQTAFQRLRFSAKQTMVLAQRLYEQGFITYMRTDSLNLSQDSLVNASAWIKENLGEKYLLPAPRTFKTKSKSAQEAHEAIRPTEASRTPESLRASVDPRELKLYELIWRRFLASQLPDASLENTKVDINVNDHIFRASGSRLLFDGFIKIYPMKFSENILPELKEGDELKINSITPVQHFTEPPPRYNEASLVKALEKFGIGRPSTYAPTISTIQDRGYIEKDNERRLRPTETGKIVNGILVEHFPEIVDIGFTAKMEGELDEIAEGKATWQPVIKEFYDPFAKHLEEKYESVASQKVEEKTDEICPNCGKPMVIKRGRFGRFIACSGFPDCKTTKRIPEPSLNIKCPTCVVSPERKDDPGEVVRRRSKKGRYFFGCSKWPKCDFISWTLPGSAEDIKAKEKAAAKALKAAEAGEILTNLEEKEKARLNESVGQALPKEFRPNGSSGRAAEQPSEEV